MTAPTKVPIQLVGEIPVFAGTHVPFRKLFDYLIAGKNIYQFMEDFPTVSMELIVATLRTAEELLLAKAGIVAGEKYKMETLEATVREVVAGYAGKGMNGYDWLTQNDDGTVFVVAGVGEIKGKRFCSTALLVRIFGDLVIVELDHNDKIVADALVQAGIPREKIILAYAGEPVPERA